MSIPEQLAVDALVVTSATNRRYFSGWSAEDQAPDRPSGVMLVTPTEKLLLASPTNLPWAESERLPDVTAVAMMSSWPEAIAALVNEHGFTRVGFEDAVTPVAAWRQLTKALGANVELVAVGPRVDQLRERKSPRELDLIREAIALTDAAFEQASAQLKVGQTEREFAQIVDDALRDMGSDGQAFDTIVASGPNAAKPHHSPGNRVIEAGDPVIIDMGGRVNGYCGDLTRTIWMGQPGDQLGTMYCLVAAAQRAAISAVKAGVAAKDVDRAARDVFAAANMEHHFVHGVGHALGLRIHEVPFLMATSADILRAGSVVTIEPGLYFPGWGGVRIEDVVIVTEDGCDNLTRAPKRLGQ